MQIVYGGERAFNALTYQNNMRSDSQRTYFSNEMQNLVNISQSFQMPEVGQQFMNQVQNLYDYVNGSEAMRIAKAAIAQVTHIFQEDNIRTIHELTSIQNAASVMQRWIMANPMVRELYHAQQCDGYSSTYVDQYPGAVGDNHYDYRRVMNHLVTEDDTHGWVAKHYVEDLDEGDRELELFEKVHILNTWEIVEGFMSEGKSDPTSIWNSNL